MRLLLSLRLRKSQPLTQEDNAVTPYQDAVNAVRATIRAITQQPNRAELLEELRVSILRAAGQPARRSSR